MKKAIILIFAVCLVACSSQNVAPSQIPTSVRVKDVSSVTSTQVPTNTSVPETTTSTAQLTTVTLQPPATCPALDQKARLPLGSVFKNKKAPYHDARTAILNFLNQGGDPKMAVKKLTENNISASLLDLTNDGVPEFILPSGYLTVFGCKDGKYASLLDISPSESNMTAVPLVIQDINQNGLLELLIGRVEKQDLTSYQIYEWNESHFSNLLSAEVNEDSIYTKNQMIYTVGQSNAEKGRFEGNWEIVDIGNGPKRIVLHAGVYDNYISASDLENSLTLKWDGSSYIVARFATESTPTPVPTFTPLPFSATCSNKVPELRFGPPAQPHDTNNAILEYLNAGGMPEKLDRMKYGVTIKDLNNDTTPEIIVYDYSFPDFVMFTCQNGKYREAVTQRIQSDVVASFVEIVAIRDNNRNGFPEVFIKAIGCVADECGALYVVEWDGEHFVEKLKGFDFGDPVNYSRMDFPKDVYLKDVDGDGVAEFIWTGELFPSWSSDRWAFYPQRLATHIFKWDGMNYTAQPVEYAAPQFRFEAVQDGDRYSKFGFYEKALRSYHQAATQKNLRWWTEDFYNSTIAPYGLGPCAENQSSCPVAKEDPNEQSTLSAYASFKTMVVYILLNDIPKAEATYQNLLTAYPIETPGYSIARMATTFWNEYQISQSIPKACLQSVDYIRTQSNVLMYLTGSQHSFQGIHYENEIDEICPFQ